MDKIDIMLVYGKIYLIRGDKYADHICARNDRNELSKRETDICK